MADTGMRVAHSIVLDARDGSISIEGARLPYHLRDEPVVADLDGMVGAVTVTFYADNVELVSKTGERSHPIVARLGPELEWARREARRIVLEGMADIVQRLWDSRMTPVQKTLDELLTITPEMRVVQNLDDDEIEALVSGTTHSKSGQSTEREGDTA